MPFNQPFPRSFTTSSIRDHAPALSGVYGISNASEWIYIGESDNIQQALLAHLHQLRTHPSTGRPTGFVFEICERTRRSATHDRLILEYEPTCNDNWAWHR